MRITVLPKSGLGRASVVLAVACGLFLILFLPYAVFALGVAAAVTGVVGIQKNKDWSILVLLATLIGVFVLFYGVRLLFFARGA